MTIFELRDDYRTTFHKALDLLQLTEEDIASVTSYYELFAKLALPERSWALAAVEVYKHFLYRHTAQRVCCSRDIYELMEPCLRGIENEECWVVLMGNANKVLKKIRLSVGGIDRTVIDVRLVLREAVRASASALALLHNHPGGSRLPSREDNQLTSRLKQACEVIGIRLFDHLIFTDTGFYSYADEGRL